MGKGVTVPTPPNLREAGRMKSCCPQKTLLGHLHTRTEIRAPPQVSLGILCIEFSYSLPHWVVHPKGRAQVALISAPCAQLHARHTVSTRLQGDGEGDD